MKDAETRPFPRWMTVALAAALLTLLAGSLWFYRDQEQAVRREAADRLESIGHLKVDQIVAWRNERLGDAAVLMESPEFVQSAARFFGDPRDANAQVLRAHFLSLQTHCHYADVLIADPSGRVLLSLAGRTAIYSGYPADLATAVRDRKPVFSDLYTVAPGQGPLVSVVAPILAGSGQSTTALGAVVLVNDASQFLYPLIESWPTPSRSAETLLVRRDGDSVLFLNNLRYQSGTALSLRIPLSQTDVPVVMAVQGKEGFVEGKDYRGVEVATIILPVPDTPWFIEAKEDAAEVYADWRNRIVLIQALFAGLTGLVLLFGLMAWQRNRRAHYQALYRAEARARASIQRHSITLQAIGDAVIATDDGGRVEMLNPTAEALTGWSHEEAVGRPMEEVFHIVHEETRERAEDPVAKVLREGLVVGLANHTVLMSRDGSEKPIADSAAPIHDDQGAVDGVVLVFRDQTDERRSHRLIQARLTLLEYVSTHTEEELLTKALDEICPLVDSPIGFYHFVDADQKGLSLQRWSTRALDEFCRIDSSEQHYGLDQAGVWADCVRQMRPVVHNDYQALPDKKGMPEGHATVVRELVVPVLRDGKAVAILGVGNKPGDYTEHDVEAVSYLADVTWNLVENRRAHQALREGEERYRSILETTMDGFCLVDKYGDLLDANETYRRMCGYSRGELMTMCIPDLEASETPEDTVEHLERAMKLGRDRFETRHRHKDGHIFDVEVSIHYQLTGEGTFLAFIRDISEQKQSAQALRESEERFSSFMAHLPAAAFIKDETGRTVFANEYLQQLLGFENWEGKTTPELIEEAVGQQMAEDDRRALAEGPLEFQETVTDSQGAQRSFETIKFPIRVEGKPTLLGGIAVDITERRRVEEALRESEAYIKAVMDNLPLGVAVNSVDPSVKFEYMNDNFPRIYRTTREALADPDAFWNVVYEDPVFREEIKKRVLDDNASGDPERMHWDDVPITRTGADTTYISAKNSPVPGTPLVISTVWDVTERKALEGQFRQAQKMESVGRLAGGVAHDFNNMLGVILGHTEIALERVDSAQPLFTDLQEIRRAAEHSASLTRQLLAFARKQTATPVVLDLNETVEGMLKMLRRLIGEDIDLAWQPGAGLWPVKIDPSQIDQVLTNLFVNSRDAITGVGKITIETGNTSIDAEDVANSAGLVPGDYVTLVMSDSGCGMDKDTMDKLFEPFFTTKEVGKGTGLGLATVYGIVKQNQGFINVYSEPDHGTTFRIYLPRHAGEASPISERILNKEPARLSVRGHETILLVEDEASILDLTKTLLESQGYTVLSASIPGEAIRLAEAHPGEFDLLITDVILPEMSGRDLSSHLLSFCPDIKKLFMSGYTADIISHRGVLEEGVHFIQKPFSVKKLLAKVRETLDDE